MVKTTGNSPGVYVRSDPKSHVELHGLAPCAVESLAHPRVQYS